MKNRIAAAVLAVISIAAFTVFPSVAPAATGQPKSADAKVDAVKTDAASAPLKILLVAGGCCHDYATQSKLLKDGIEKRINAEVTVVLSDSNKTTATFAIYQNDDWAKGYDVVIHDECSANVTKKPYVDRILAAHRNGTPAVNLHCAMHSYRWGDFQKPVDADAENGGWYQMIGVQSTSHGAQKPIELKYTAAEHPLTRGLPDWTTTNEELYNNVRVYSKTTALIAGTQSVGGNESTKVVGWVNEYGPRKTKIFSTTVGHNNETVGDDRYLDLIVRGLLWTTGNLTEDGKPSEGLSK